MTTGKIEYEHPDLPDDWGLMEIACADGEHRFLPDAPRCGCGKKANMGVEYQRLRDVVVEALRHWRSSARRSAACD